jgi:hypothetical protein
VILPWRGVAALHTGGYRGSARFAVRWMEKGSAASWMMEKDVATSPCPRSRIHASQISYLLQRMKKFYSSWHVHSTQSPTGIELWEGYLHIHCIVENSKFPLYFSHFMLQDLFITCSSCVLQCVSSMAIYSKIKLD